MTLAIVEENGSIPTPNEEIPTITSWEHVESLPNFVETVDSRNTEILDLVAPYDLSPLKKCGLTECRTPHGDGFVAKTTDGRLFKMGHCCGEKYFPEKFKFLRDRLKERFNEQTVRNEIIDRQERAGQMIEQVTALLSKAVGSTAVKDWYNKFHKLASTGFETATEERLKLRCQQKKPEITIAKEVKNLSERDKDILDASGMEARYEETVAYRIMGLTSLRTYKKLHPSKLSNLMKKTEDFSRINPYALSRQELKKWQRWLIGFEKKLREIEDIAEECRRFHNKENLKNIRTYKLYL